MIWNSNMADKWEESVKADTDLLVLVPHAACAGLCAFCCNTLMRSDQRSPDSHKFSCGGSFNSSTDWAINGSEMVAGVNSLPWLVNIAACEAGGTLLVMVISRSLLPSGKVPPLELAILVCGNTTVVDSCFWQVMFVGVWCWWVFIVILLLWWSVTIAKGSMTEKSRPVLYQPVEPNQAWAKIKAYLLANSEEECTWSH